MNSIKIITRERAAEILESFGGLGLSGWNDPETRARREKLEALRPNQAENHLLNELWGKCPGSWSLYDVVAALAHGRPVPPTSPHALSLEEIAEKLEEQDR